jgi:hypothetical protein
VHPGYSIQHFSRADVLYPAGTELPAAYRSVDAYIAQSEIFHQFPVRSRVMVIVCRNWSDFKRFFPIPKAEMLAGATLLNGTVIFITPKVTEKGLEPGEFLRHELSHATLNQHQSLLSAWQMRRQQWFVEGLAVSFGNQKAFVTPVEFVTAAQETDLLPIIYPEGHAANAAHFNMRVGYQAWRYFLEYLIETRGRSLFQQYMIAYMAKPTEYRQAFANCYGTTLQQAIGQFQDDVRTGRWHVNPDFERLQEQ